MNIVFKNCAFLLTNIWHRFLVNKVLDVVNDLPKLDICVFVFI
jgi:hypothetical protein